MALYTREDATKTARMAKDYDEYTLVVVLHTDFKGLQINNYPQPVKRLGEVLEPLKGKFEGRVVIITEKMVKEKFLNATTIKDLEVIFYQMVNYKIGELAKERETSDGASNGNVIYASDVGYNSKRMRFYVAVRETDKSIWLQRIGKKMVGGDPQNQLVVANPSVREGEPIRRRKRSGSSSVRIDDYEFAFVWDGRPVQEFSD